MRLHCKCTSIVTTYEMSWQAYNFSALLRPVTVGTDAVFSLHIFFLTVNPHSIWKTPANGDLKTGKIPILMEFNSVMSSHYGTVLNRRLSIYWQALGDLSYICIECVNTKICSSWLYLACQMFCIGTGTIRDLSQSSWTNTAKPYVKGLVYHWQDIWACQACLACWS